MTVSDRRPPDEPAGTRQVDDELSFHFERTVEELVGRGLSREDAEREARHRFGSLPRHRRDLLDLEVRREAGERRRAAMGAVTTSARAALRNLGRAPAFAFGVITILTLGLGVNAVTFGLVDRLVLSGPAGVVDAADLRRVVIYSRDEGSADAARTNLSYSDYRDLAGATTLAGAAAESGSPLLFGSGDNAESIAGRLVTANYFSLLGAVPAAGRFFTAAESERDGARVAVLGYGFWRRRFGGEAGAIGQVVAIESNRYTIVGVASAGFNGAGSSRVDVFLPLEAASDEMVDGPWQTNRRFTWMNIVVRLAPGVADAAAAAEATAIGRRAIADDTRLDQEARTTLTSINPVRGDTASGEIGVAALVGVVAVLVLLIAVANATNLFLARGVRRRSQIAVRLALGSGRGRLMAEQATEGAVLALAGAGVAVLIALVGGAAVQRLLFPDVDWPAAGIGPRGILLIAAFAVVGGAAAAALPMWRAGRSDFMGWLKSGTQRVARPRSRTQSALLVLQGAFSALLLVGAGLFLRSLNEAQTVDLGLDTDRLLVLSVIAGGEPRRPDFRELVRARVEAIPGVERTTVVAGTLPFVSSWAVSLRVPGLPERPRVESGGPYLHAVAPGYFDVVGTEILEGRAFGPEDRMGTPHVVIVSERMARLYWPGEPAIGRCLEIGEEPAPCSRVVGIAEDTRRQEIVEGEQLLYYVPIDQAPDENLRRGGRLLIRTASANDELVARVAETVRRETLAVQPGLRYVAARRLDDVISPQVSVWRTGATLFAAFGVLALVVAAAGFYSSVAFDVEGRRDEMAVRAALGASPRGIAGLVVGGGLRLAAVGIGIGLAAAWFLAPAIAGLLYGVSARDAGVFVTVVVVLGAAAFLASAGPGLRAAKVNPSLALRSE